jgi:predicted nucleotidyltransferase
MGFGGFAKIAERRRRERALCASRSAELRRRLLELGFAVLRAYGVREAWLFGSVASGTAAPESDLDLLVMPIAAVDYWPLRRELEAVLGCPLDLYTQDDDPTFLHKVLERGELIYEVRSRASEGGHRR